MENDEKSTGRFFQVCPVIVHGSGTRWAEVSNFRNFEYDAVHVTRSEHLGPVERRQDLAGLLAHSRRHPTLDARVALIVDADFGACLELERLAAERRLNDRLAFELVMSVNASSVLSTMPSSGAAQKKPLAGASFWPSRTNVGFRCSQNLIFTASTPLIESSPSSSNLKRGCTSGARNISANVGSLKFLFTLPRLKRAPSSRILRTRFRNPEAQDFRLHLPAVRGLFELLDVSCSIARSERLGAAAFASADRTTNTATTTAVTAALLNGISTSQTLSRVRLICQRNLPRMRS